MTWVIEPHGAYCVTYGGEGADTLNDLLGDVPAFYISKGYGNPLFEVTPFDRVPMDEELIACANRMAAAPDLLAACQEALLRCSMSNNMRRELQAAISKATGAA